MAILGRMEELIIDDKKYVSTKRAAKETGYAKDYVGQLCREGRVPARLVGRSWYVLESAIQDHRFGAPHEAESTPAKTAEEASTLPPTWEAPKYEADSGTSMPSVSRINRLHDSASTVSQEAEGDTEPVSLRDAWQEWFSVQQPGQSPVVEQEERFLPESEEIAAVEEVASPQEEIEEEAGGEVEIPIHTFYEPQIAALRPRVEARKEVEQGTGEASPRLQALRRQRRASSSVPAKIIVGVGVLCAVSSVLVAALNSRYADAFAISFTQAAAITGISVYQK